MAILDPLFNYCERTSTSVFAEPLNVLSNASFFIAAWLLWKLYHSIAPEKRDQPSLILTCMVGVIGLGSTLFHIFANKLTMLADVIPIAVFTFYYLWIALRQLLSLSQKQTLQALGTFIVAAFITAQLPWRFNGSIDYFPCLAALLIIGYYLRKRGHPAAVWLVKAGALFAVSLTFRSVDFHFCPSFHVGTHFVWHALNGAVLYLLTRAIIGVR